MPHDVHAIAFGLGLLVCLGAAFFLAELLGNLDPLCIGDDPPAYTIHHQPLAPERPIHVDLHPEYDALINAQWDAEPGTLRHVLRGLPQN